MAKKNVPKEIEVTEQSIALYRSIILDPNKHNADFKPLSDIFEKAETATPKHVLYDQYLSAIKREGHQLPKLFFYMVMDDVFPQEKCENGDLGYLAALTPIKHQLEYSPWSARFSWCPICKEHFFNEENKDHTTLSTKQHYHFLEPKI